MTDPDLVHYRPGRRGHYESLWLRANDPDHPRAVWLRFTIFAPAGRPEAAIGEVWAMVFDRGRCAPVAVRATAPIDDCTFRNGPLDVRVAGASLSGAATTGEVALGEHRVAWDLTIDGGQGPIWMLPARLYRGPVPKAKTVCSRPLVRLSGTATVDGHELELTAWPGSTNHNWGSAHTDHYAYGQVAGFDGEPGSFLEVATARIRVGRWWTPFSTLLVLRHDGRELASIDPLRGMRSRARFDLDGWQFTVDTADATIDGRITPHRDDLVAVPYLDPPGGVRHCINTKIAAAELTVTERSSGRRTQLHSAHGCVFEMLPVRTDHGIPLAFPPDAG